MTINGMMRGATVSAAAALMVGMAVSGCDGTAQNSRSGTSIACQNSTCVNNVGGQPPSQSSAAAGSVPSTSEAASTSAGAATTPGVAVVPLPVIDVPTAGVSVHAPTKSPSLPAGHPTSVVVVPTASARAVACENLESAASAESRDLLDLHSTVESDGVSKVTGGTASFDAAYSTAYASANTVYQKVSVYTDDGGSYPPDLDFPTKAKNLLTLDLPTLQNGVKGMTTDRDPYAAYTGLTQYSQWALTVSGMNCGS